ncbi:hypothetical protein LguiA_007993 [Lonicera macranthoides]
MVGRMLIIYNYVPSDEYIISDILNLKVRGEALAPCDSDVVKEIDSHDLYGGGKKPIDIFSICAEDPERDRCAHLLTTPPPPSSISENGDIGAWKAFIHHPEPVADRRLGNLRVGSKNTFLYDNDDGGSNSNLDKLYGWFMTEYTTLLPPTVPSLNYVLCRIERFEYPDVGGGEEGEEEEGDEEEEERLMELDKEAVKIAADAAAIRAPAPAA